MTELWRISLSYAVFGIIVSGGTVIDGAPIGGWMQGKSLDQVSSWVKRKGGTIERVS